MKAPGTVVIAALDDIVERIKYVRRYTAVQGYATIEIPTGHRAPLENPEITAAAVISAMSR